MSQNQNIEKPGSHGKTVQNRSTVAAATANSSLAKADSGQPAGKDEGLNIEVRIETEQSINGLVLLWLLIAVSVTLTIIAGYLLWEKINF